METSSCKDVRKTKKDGFAGAEPSFFIWGLERGRGARKFAAAGNRLLKFFHAVYTAAAGAPPQERMGG